MPDDTIYPELRKLLTMPLERNRRISPEHLLWRTVVLQTLADVINAKVSRCVYVPALTSNGFRTKAQVLNYEVNHAWFREICEMAELPHERIVSFANRILKTKL